MVENAAVPAHKLQRICVTQGSPSLKGSVCQAAFGLQWQLLQWIQQRPLMVEMAVPLCPRWIRAGHRWGISFTLNAQVNSTQGKAAFCNLAL